MGVLALENRSMKFSLADSRVWQGGSRRVRRLHAREAPNNGEAIKCAPKVHVG